MVKVIKVTSDNFDGQLLTLPAYKQLTLEMSTGDYHTHKHEFVLVDDYTNVIGLVETTDGNGNVIGTEFEELA